MLGIMSTAEVFLVRGLLKGMSDKDTEIQPYVLLEPNLSLFCSCSLPPWVFHSCSFYLLFLQREKKWTHIFNTARN